VGAANVRCWDVIVKTAVVHTVTYVVVGVAAFSLFNYPELIRTTPFGANFRSLEDPVVMAGPLFQPIRGSLFGLIFYLLRVPFFSDRRGWLLMWATLVGIGIFGTFAAPTGSIEGVIYTVVPLSLHVAGLPETLLQSLLLSYVVFQWVAYPQKRWLGRLMWIAFTLVMAFFTAILIARPSPL
jgi:hypothetical protein